MGNVSKGQHPDQEVKKIHQKATNGSSKQREKRAPGFGFPRAARQMWGRCKNASELPMLSEISTLPYTSSKYIVQFC